MAIALYSGLDTCLVIDSGANNTVVTAVVEQRIVTGSCHKAVGGTHLTKQLYECLMGKGLDFEVSTVVYVLRIMHCSFT